MYIYESPDNGSTVYRRRPGQYKRELIQKDGIPFEMDTETEKKLKRLMETNGEQSKN